MRAGVISALAAAAGVSAHGSHGSHGDFSILPYEGDVRGCDKHHKGDYFADEREIFFPGHHGHEGRRWDLCRDNHHCKHEDRFAEVQFEFFEEELIFDFIRPEKREERDEFFFEEVEIFLSTGEPRFDDEHRYGSDFGHCKHEHDKYRCHLPWEKIIDGGFHGLCPHKHGHHGHHGHHNHHDNFIFFVKIKTIINIRDERIELYNRGGHHNNHHGHHNNKHHNKHLYGRSYNNYNNHHNYHHNDYNNVEDDHFRLGYSCTECKHQEYFEEHDRHREQCGSHGCGESSECGYNKHCPERCHHEPCHHHEPNPHPDPHGYGPHCSHCPTGRCHQKPHHLYARGENRGNRFEDFECEGAFVKAFGRGDRTFAFEELTNEGYPNSCGIDEGYYHRYPASDLEVSVNGPVTYEEREFGFFEIELVKKHDDAFIFIEVKVEDVNFFVAEIAAFVECNGGVDDYFGSNFERPNVCRPESYPHRHHNEEGINEFKFEILDEFKCQGDYFIAIFVLVCVEDRSECHYCRY